MCSRLFSLSFLFLLLSARVVGQHPLFLKTTTTGHSGTGANIDIRHHRFEWNINPDESKRISGSVTTWFETIENNVTNITFDFNKSAYDNASLVVTYHGNTVSHSFPVSGNTDILTISLPTSLAKGVLDSVTIFYDGTPPPRIGHAIGAQQDVINGYPLFYTLSESYEDKDWWPCKADMQDKIDSITTIITTPESYTPAANGTLISTIVNNGTKVSTFKHKYPIASYLVGIAVTQYDIYDRGTVNINGTEMPVMYYISKGRNPSAELLSVFDRCKQELQVFSNLFGDYAFKNEKYGMYEFGFNGGMEHQTFSGMSWNAFNNARVVAHELMHQWFGDKVTMATWNHLWLSEGFARYGEVLATEYFPSIGIIPSNLRNTLKNNANSAALQDYGCIIPNAFIENSTTLWNSPYGTTVYDRGAMVVSMLRTLLGDQKYFQACRDYLADPNLAYQSATTDDLRAHMESVLGGFDLSGFFNSFTTGNGYPDYSGSNAIQWQPVGTNRIRFGIYGQSKTAHSTVDYYNAVLPIRVQGANGEDTLIVLYDRGTNGVCVGGNGIVTGNSPTPEVYLGFTPVTVTFDPYSMSLATGQTLLGTVIATTITDFTVRSAEGKNTATLKLTDYSNVGHVEWEYSTNGVTFSTLGNMENKGQGTYQADDAARNTTTFYRAKVFLKSGQYLNSDIAKILPQRGADLATLLSNPARGVLKVKLPALNEETPFKVIDTQGKLFQRGILFSDQSIKEIDIHTLSKGIYFLQLQSKQLQQTIRFLVN